MKKLLSLFVVAALTLGGLTSCAKQEEKNDSGKKPVKSTAAGKSEPAKAEKTTITVWHSADASIADTLEKKLNSLLKNTKVKLERKENLSDSLKLVSNDPKSAPDMFLWAHDKVGVFAEMGIIEPVNKLISDEQMKDLIPMTLAAGTYKKEKYQLPLYFESLLFIYNKDLMKNPPKTTDELLAAAKAETKDNKYVFVEQHSTSYCIAPWLHGFGGYMINSEKKPGLKAAKLNYGIAPMPKLPNGEPLKPFSGVQGLQVVKQAAENKTAAVKEVLAAAINPEVGIALAKVANCAPANSQAYKDAEVGKNEMISTLREMAKTLVPMPNIPEMDVMWGATDGLLAEINKNGKDVAGSCEKYQKQATEQIANMK